MKNLFICILFSLLGIQFSYAAALITDTKPFFDKNKYEVDFQDVVKSSVEKFSPENFEKVTEKKTRLHERLALKLIQKKIRLKFKKFEKEINKLQSEDCDFLILKNGEEVEVKILEISTSTIRYKKCDYLEGPVYTIDKAEVFMIKYSNGTKEIIRADANPVTAKYEDENTAGAMVAGVSLGFFFGLLGILGAFFYPNGSKRKAFWAGWGIGFAFLTLLTLVAVVLVL